MNCRCYVTSAIFLVRLSMNLSVGLRFKGAATNSCSTLYPRLSVWNFNVICGLMFAILFVFLFAVCIVLPVFAVS
jgi:hypothetical protein